MALVINNRVRETTATTGTGAVTLAGAVDGFQTFAAGIGNSNTTYYAISLNTANEWEVGLGTLNSDSSTLTRTTVLESSNPEVSPQTRFLKIRPLYDFVEPFEVHLFPNFSFFCYFFYVLKIFCTQISIF